jgi:plastocyanin domain-containing protein
MEKKEAEMKRTSFMILAAIALFVVSLALAAEWKEKRVEAVVGQDGVQRVEITAGGYYFDPNTIVVKINVPVELIVKRTSGGFGHNIMLLEPEAGVGFQETLNTDPKSIKFTPSKAGKYLFVCTHKVPFSKSHKDRGMYGYLEVVE